jgi:hypothetical protein
MSQQPDRSVVVVFLVGALAMLVWLAFLLKDRNDDIERLRVELGTARAQTEEAREDVEQSDRRFRLFREQVRILSQSEMTSNVISGAVIGIIGQAGCAPGYSDPECDLFYEFAETWEDEAQRYLREFSLWNDVQRFGRFLVTEAEERTDEALD